jgi:hypothetical protein
LAEIIQNLDAGLVVNPTLDNVKQAIADANDINLTDIS